MHSYLLSQQWKWTDQNVCKVLLLDSGVSQQCIHQSEVDSNTLEYLREHHANGGPHLLTFKLYLLWSAVKWHSTTLGLRLSISSATEVLLWYTTLPAHSLPATAQIWGGSGVEVVGHGACSVCILSWNAWWCGYICMQLWHIHTFYLVFMVRPLLPSALHCQNSKKEREVILDLFFSLFSFTIYFQKIYSLSYPHVGSLNALWKHCLSLHHMIYLSSHMTCYLVMWSTHLGIKHLFSANGRYNDGSSSHKATVIVWLMHAWKHRCNYISSSLCCC